MVQITSWWWRALVTDVARNGVRRDSGSITNPNAREEGKLVTEVIRVVVGCAVIAVEGKNRRKSACL